ncbi:hypothetical protein Taro_023111 [Colocasia esculenta]|uniref:RING-type domain-containing protein n=1 Tax=Colocasia esculenta TaxID=4460 RepID=A0A843V5I3_COLES|nr:hypothetical protein [Colocasia esculenta]
MFSSHSIYITAPPPPTSLSSLLSKLLHTLTCLAATLPFHGQHRAPHALQLRRRYYPRRPPLLPYLCGGISPHCPLRLAPSTAPPPPAVLQSLTTLSFQPSSADHANFVECTICLADFTEGVEVRVLPCGHGFHIACIDLWLSSHATCPTCRWNLVSGAPAGSADPV